MEQDFSISSVEKTDTVNIGALFLLFINNSFKK